MSRYLYDIPVSAVSKLQEKRMGERIALRETNITTLPEQRFHSCPQQALLRNLSIIIDGLTVVKRVIIIYGGEGGLITHHDRYADQEPGVGSNFCRCKGGGVVVLVP